MANEAFNDWSPFKRALYMTAESGGDDPNDPGGIGADAQAKAASVPAPTQPTHRIEDDRTAGTRGTTPQGTPPIVSSPGDNSGFYDGANYDRPNSPRYPLERQITSDRGELNRMNQPTRVSLMDRVKGAITGAATGARGEGALEQQATLRDRAEARKQQERETLGNRIEQSTRTLSQEGISEEGQNLRARMAAQAQVASAQRLGETLASRERNVDVQQAGATGRTQAQVQGREDVAQGNRESRETMFNQGQAEKYREFQSTDQYRRWKAQMDNSTKLHVAQLQQSKAPAALMQTAVFADGGIKSLNDAERAMAKLEQSGVMGQSWAQNKAEDWVFGKGAVDPSVPPDVRKTIGELRTSLNLAASAMTRAHTQRGSKEVYDDLKQRLGPGQDWSALRGAIAESQDMLGTYVQAASDSNIGRIRAGSGATPPEAPSQGKRVNLDDFLREPK